MEHTEKQMPSLSNKKEKSQKKKIKLKNNKAKKVFVKFNTTAGSELPAQ